jgi:PHD/YefM family antitoxin component YafN of YafNO toxin-antitoxin module
MDSKHSVDIPGVEFLVNQRGHKRAVLIDLKKHAALWEDLYDAYLVQRRRREPRESLAQVKRLLRGATKRRARA